MHEKNSQGELQTARSANGEVEHCLKRWSKFPDYSYHREDVQSALEKFTDPLTFIGFLKHRDEHVRFAAGCKLGRIADRRAVEPLIVALKDNCESVRRAAVESLGLLKDPRAVEPLIALLKHKRTPWGIRIVNVIARIIGRILYADILDPIFPSYRYSKVNMLRSNLLSRGHKEDERPEVCDALGKIGDPRATEHLLAAFQEGDSNSKYRNLSRAAIAAIGEIGDPRAVMPLVRDLASSDRKHRIMAAHMLGQLNDPRAVDSLVSLIKNSDAELRSMMPEWKEQGRVVAPGCPHCWVDQEFWDEINITTSALARIGDKRAIEPVRQLWIFENKYGCRVFQGEDHEMFFGL